MSDRLTEIKARAATMWTERDLYQKLQDDCWDYALPYRRPPRMIGKGQSRTSKLFDNTGTVCAMRFAGQLQQDLFPPNEPFFRLVPSALIKKINPDMAEKLAVRLETIADMAHAVLRAGEFDVAAHEMCVDLNVGTGAMLVLPGDRERPVRFINIPVDEIAIEIDAFGDILMVDWKTQMTIRAIRKAFPKGVFPDEFVKLEKTNGGDLKDIHQCFTRNKAGIWEFCAFLEDSKEPIVSTKYRLLPMIVARYHRVPGESYGRGPLMLNLPLLKTLNKAVELTLQSASIQMLGIWGYRAGGAFNPDTVKLAPGAFWPMNSTGGVMGSDVQRLDTASSRIDVSQLILQDLRMAVQAGMYDDRLPDKGLTPRSASEIIMLKQQGKRNYVGAFSRLMNELIAPLVKLIIEALVKQKLIESDVELDSLLTQIEVISPLGAALTAQTLAPTTDFIQAIAVSEGPQAVPVYVKMDKAMADIGQALGVRASHMNNAAERAEVRKQQAAALAAQQALEAAPAIASVASAAKDMEQAA
jgi:hypothetical protein